MRITRLALAAGYTDANMQAKGAKGAMTAKAVKNGRQAMVTVLAVAGVIAAGTATTAAGAAQSKKRGRAKAAPPAGTFSAQRSNARTVTIRIGQAVDFDRGRMTTKQAEGGLVFQYMAPQDTSGMKFNGGTGRLEYRVGMKIENFIPLLSASHSARFKTRPQPGQFTSGDVYNWSEDDVPATGAYYIVQSKLNDQHYLVHVLKADLPMNQPNKWAVTLTYEPYAVRPGAAGAKNAAALSGTLRLKNLYTDKLIVDLDMASGRMVQVADGYQLDMNARGDMVYYDNSGALIVSDPAKKRVASLRLAGESPAISPDGKRVAIVEQRSKTYDTSFGKITSAVTMGAVVVYDIASGKEVAAFPDKNYCEWTPDGRIVMSQYGGNGLYVTDAGLKDLTTISKDVYASQMAVSPDGKQIALVVGGRIWAIGMDGSDLRQIAVTGRPQSLPAWSPDGKWVVFSEETDSLHTDLRAVRLSDSNIVTVRTSAGSPLHAQSRMFWRP